VFRRTLQGLDPPFSSPRQAAHLKRRGKRDRTRDLVERQTQLLTRIVDGLLDMARISKGQVTLQRERIDLARLVRESAEDRRGLLEAVGVALDLDLPPAPLWIQGDPVRLAQVLGNILDNAGKFTPAGGRVAVRLATDGASWQAVVTLRTGVGIEPEVLPHIFETFAQGHQPLDRSQGGLGLGLSVARELLELHGDSLEATSDGPGKGAEFTLRLPCEELPEPEPVTESGSPGKEPRRVLVVEDNRDAAESLGLFLELCGFGVTLAYNGPEGLEAAKSVRPDIVLCDIGLPGMDGFQVASALWQDPETADVRLIAVTGYGQEEDRKRALAAGFDVHWVKPVDPEKLLGYMA
jgi:CheY-like chemotaxis protein